MTYFIESSILQFSFRQIMWELHLAYKKCMKLLCPGYTQEFWMHTAIMCIEGTVLICGEQITVTTSLDLTRSLI